MTPWDQKPDTEITESGEEILRQIVQSEFSVLVGPNNCGKSFLLKTLTQRIGPNASYIGPARYNNFNVLNHYNPRKNKKSEQWRQFIRRWQQEQQNFDNSPLNLQQAIAELSDDRRDLLSEIVEQLLGTQLEILYTVPDNTMSQKYVSCHGHNISYTSSGFRLIATIVTCLLDTDYNIFLVDEPELGISPEAQGVLADFLFDNGHRKKYFEHVETLILATHSTIFLDRRDIGNNYSVTRQGNVIDVRQTKSLTEFNGIHFFLLGNRLESLYLPSCIVLAEGKTDHAYISHVLKQEFPGVQFSIVNAGSDSRMKEVVSIAGSLLTDLQKSPYRTRIVPILDKTHGRDVVQMLTQSGIPEDNIIIWEKNGIEYYYPCEVIDEIFGKGDDLEIVNDTVSRNGISYRKAELCDKVIEKMGAGTFGYPLEFEEKLLAKIRCIVGGNSE